MQDLGRKLRSESPFCESYSQDPASHRWQLLCTNRRCVTRRDQQHSVIRAQMSCGFPVPVRSDFSKRAASEWLNPPVIVTCIGNNPCAERTVKDFAAQNIEQFRTTRLARRSVDKDNRRLSPILRGSASHQEAK